MKTVKLRSKIEEAPETLTLAKYIKQKMFI